MTTVLRRALRWQVGAVLVVLTLLGLAVQGFAGSAARAADDGSHPSGSFDFNGSLLIGCPTGAVLCTQGHLSGGLTGSFTMTLLTITPSATPGVNFFTGYLVLNTASGQLRCGLNGATNETTSSEGEFGEICEINGGTGIYKSARGDLRMIGTSTSTLLIPTGSGIYQGTVRTA
jgi:hypothetical protein